jgi:homoserine dehydrogenase
MNADQDRQAELGIGLLGCGVVGTAVARALPGVAPVIRARTGRMPVIRAVAVRDPSRQRNVPVPAESFTDDPWHVATRADVDVVVEVMGGLDPAGGAIDAALGAGKHVVSANKELLSRQFEKLRECAVRNGRRLLFEAAVMAGTPAISTVLSLAGDRITRLQGLLNGTCGYCLDRMRAGLSLAEAVAEAQAHGYAEADPSADVEGRDAAAKLAILATLAFGLPVSVDDVAVTGITRLRPAELARASRRGEHMVLLAEAWPDGGKVAARVAPASLPASHALSGICGHHNGLLIEADLAGPVLIQGPGAGGRATASAILSDLVTCGLAAA